MRFLSILFSVFCMLSQVNAAPEKMKEAKPGETHFQLEGTIKGKKYDTKYVLIKDKKGSYGDQHVKKVFDESGKSFDKGRGIDREKMQTHVIFIGSTLKYADPVIIYNQIPGFLIEFEIRSNKGKKLNKEHLTQLLKYIKLKSDKARLASICDTYHVWLADVLNDYKFKECYRGVTHEASNVHRMHLYKPSKKTPEKVSVTELKPENVKNEDLPKPLYTKPKHESIILGLYEENKKGRTPVGGITGKIFQRGKDKILFIKRLAVAPSHRRRGLGKKLIKHLIEYDNTVTLVDLETINPIAMRVYDRMGFKLVSSCTVGKVTNWHMIKVVKKAS